MPPPHHHDHHHHHGHHHPHHHDDELSKYDDGPWDELPPHLKEAATTLNWTKKIWDEDGEPDTEDMDWDELTHEQRKAAEQFGYHPKLWDEGHGHRHAPPPHHKHDHHHDHHHQEDKKEEEKKDNEEDVDVDVSKLDVNDAEQAYDSDKEDDAAKKEESKKKKQAMFKTSKSYGGDGGEKFDHGNNRNISKIIVHDNGHVVEGLEVSYANATQKAGKTCGKGKTFQLERGEFITSVTIRHNKFVQSIGFKTNKGNMLGPIGGSGWKKIDLRGNDTEGEEVKVNAPFKYQLCGLTGRAGNYIDQLAFRWGPVPQAGKKQSK